jgi:hypothetical protein
MKQIEKVKYQNNQHQVQPTLKYTEVNAISVAYDVTAASPASIPLLGL